MRRSLVSTLSGLLLFLALPAEAASPPLAPMPEAHKPKPDQVALGRSLFFDARLSGDGSLACASCHDPAKGFSNGKRLSDAYPGALHFRAVPSIVNAAHRKYLHWDGRITDLADLVRDHITDAQFMNADGRLVIERLRQVPEYEEGFKRAFGGEPTFGRILNVVAAFMRSVNSTGHPLDRYLAGDKGALSAEARRGLELFTGKAGCAQCHGGALLTDEQFHRLGVPENPQILAEPLRHITFRRHFKILGTPGYHALREDVGLYALTKREEDRSKFRTPSLREVGLRQAFMHNGAFRSPEEVVDFYDRGGGGATGKDPKLASLGLSQQERRDLVAFLRSLKSAPVRIDRPNPPAYQARALGKN
ncbi:MAG: c-type cytochrome [Myxococcales bacterium]|nr:c-type cytochrome [Myxococcales bacterium]